MLESGIQTGTLHFAMLTDGLEYLTRNPFRGANQEPDDVRSPTWVDFTMDAVVSSEDPHGRVPASATASRASRRPQVEWAPL